MQMWFYLFGVIIKIDIMSQPKRVSYLFLFFLFRSFVFFLVIRIGIGFRKLVRVSVSKQTLLMNIRPK